MQFYDSKTAFYEVVKVVFSLLIVLFGLSAVKRNFLNELKENLTQYWSSTISFREEGAGPMAQWAIKLTQISSGISIKDTFTTTDSRGNFKEISYLQNQKPYLTFS